MGREFGPLILLLWGAIRWAIAILTSIAVIQLIYHNAVPRTQPWHSVLPGAVLATAMWLISTALFGWYLQHYVDYSVIYGSLGRGHCVAALDVPDLAGGADWRRIQCHAFSALSHEGSASAGRTPKLAE